MSDSPASSIDPELLQGFQQTSYCIDSPDGRITLRVNQPNPELDKLLARYGCDCWAMISAGNPCSQGLPAEENQRRQQQRAAELIALGFRVLQGAGVPDHPDEAGMRAEAMLFVLGLP